MLNMLALLVLPVVFLAFAVVALVVARLVDARTPNKDPQQASWLGFVAVSLVGVLVSVAIMTVVWSFMSDANNLANSGSFAQAAKGERQAVLLGLVGPLGAGALAALLHVWLRKRSLKWALVFMAMISLPSYAIVGLIAAIFSLFAT